MKTYTSVTVSVAPALGLDLAKASFVAALRLDSDRVLVADFPNHAGGFRKLQTWLHQRFAGKVRAGLEATGIYGQALAQWLHAQGHTVHVLNPARVAAYARSTGQRNKTDPADARTIAAYVATHTLLAWQPPAPEQLDLQQLCRTRHQLAHQRQQLKNQLGNAAPAVRTYFEHLIAAFDAELVGVEQAIRTHLAAHPAQAEQVRRLTTVPGIGVRTATVVLAELPVITSESDPRALCAWCGLTPARHQSGPREGRAHLSRAGNAYLRDALFMPSLVAKRHNPLLRAFAARLASKPKKQGTILGAVSHKLLCILIGMLRHQRDFDPNWSPNPAA
jgi:transposase